MGRTVARRGSSGGRGSFHVVLLAGGSGTRFWPLSRRARPKQFLTLIAGTTLLRATWQRATALTRRDRVWVVAPADLAAAVRRELPGLRGRNLIVEPSPRDTGPAVVLACATVAREDPDAIVAILPTDHTIRDRRAFARAVRAAREQSRSGSLVCLGVRPDRPATGFGYLRLASPPRTGKATRVVRFVEKPNLGRARRFVKSGRYLWNGGMFVWRVRDFLAEAARVAPELHAFGLGTAEGRITAWRRTPRISIDHAVMEKARDVAVVPLDAGWDDLGSWDAAARLLEGRRRAGDDSVTILDSPGSLVVPGKRFIALLGLSDAVVVDTDDALLVVSRRAAEDTKRVVASVRSLRRDDLL